MNTIKKDNAHILIVDDDLTVLELFRENLEDLSLKVSIATSAKAALAMDISNFDCVVTDVMMPEIDGVQFVEQLNSNGYHNLLFFMTGYKDYPREQLAKFNPTAIIFKPFDVEEAAILIKKHLMK